MKATRVRCLTVFRAVLLHCSCLQALVHASFRSASRSFRSSLDDAVPEKIVPSASLSSSFSLDDRTKPLVCGCHECTDDVLNLLAGEHSCTERIKFLQQEYHLPEEEACIRVSRTEFRDICGPQCDPGRCDGKKLPPHEMPSTYCGCKHCTHQVWNRITTDLHTCGARISYLTDFDGLPMKEACNIVGGHEFPHDDVCGLCDPERCQPVHGTGDYRCGCARCTNDVWKVDVNGATCGERIKFLQDVEGQTEVQACRQVAGSEYPNTCGSSCNPDLCDAPLVARTPMYCFPPFSERKRYRNVWGNLTVEVKESKVEEHGVCGPHDSIFTTNTVARKGPNRLKLQFKKAAGGDSWEASEVRIRLPNKDMPFRYGTFSFSIEKIQVVHPGSEEVQSELLPPSLVLSMHTWDTTENFAIHENQNHQVGIDIGRFDHVEGEDARYAVQPDIIHRFFTGGKKKKLNYRQAPALHSFHWRPGEIEFFSSTGSGQGATTNFKYCTEDALESGYVDWIQCLPADVELRIGLWSTLGQHPPPGLAENHIVEVVIDDVSFTPSGEEFVANGGFCSKDCQCSPEHKCFSGRCTRVNVSATHYDAVIREQHSSSNKERHPQKKTMTIPMIIGLTVMSSSFGALAFIVYKRLTNPRRYGPVMFTLAPGAVKA